jgi:hemerythrin-like domain-containing protein
LDHYSLWYSCFWLLRRKLGTENGPYNKAQSPPGEVAAQANILMLRSKHLVPLSHQHQRALALCVRIDRASPIPDADLDSWQLEVAQQFRNEIAIHFAAEEQVVFPAAREFKELVELVSDLINQHGELRALFARADARTMSSADLSGFARKLSNHIRTEERRLFEMLQHLLPAERLSTLGTELDMALQGASNTCALPDQATRLRAAKKD